MLGFNSLINFIDFYIAYRFFSLFSGDNRRINKKKCIGIYLCCGINFVQYSEGSKHKSFGKYDINSSI